MRNMRLYGILLFITTLSVVVVWNSREFFYQNHAIFLLNQKEYPEAISLLTNLEQRNPENAKTRFLMIKALTVAGESEQAVAVTIDDNLTQDWPESLYWKALAEYLQGNEVTGKQLAGEFVRSGKTLKNSQSMLLARILAGVDRPGPYSDYETDGFKMLFPLEQGILLSLTASAGLQAGQFHGAAGLFQRAFCLGVRSRNMLLDGVRSAALSGNFQDADLYLQFILPKPMESLYAEFSTNYQKTDLPSLVIDGYKSYSSSDKVHRARALAWISVSYLKTDIENRRSEVVKTLDDIQKSFPQDNIIRLFRAEVDRTVGDMSKAAERLEQIHLDSPSLTTALAIWSINNLTLDEITHHLKPMISQLNPQVMLLNPQSASPVIVSPTGIKYEWNMASAEDYVLTLIAKTSDATGLRPIVKLSMDDVVVGYKSLTHSGWGSYSLKIKMTEGKHVLEIAPEVIPEDGSFNVELLGVFITAPFTQN